VTNTEENTDSSRSNLTISGAHLHQDRNLPPPFLDSPTRQQIGGDYIQGDVSSGNIQTIDCKVGGDVFQQTDQQLLVPDGFDNSYSGGSGVPDYLSRSASKTNEMIESAERFMNINLADGATQSGANGLVQGTDSPLSQPRNPGHSQPVLGYGSINHRESNTATSTYSHDNVKAISTSGRWQYINGKATHKRKMYWSSIMLPLCTCFCNPSSNDPRYILSTLLSCKNMTPNALKYILLP
jgi:hypothetical protein